MATIFEVIASYGPKLAYTRTIELDELAEWLAHRSGLNANDAERVLKELRNAIIYFNRAGTPVRLPGVGRVRVSVDRHGQMRVNVTPDPVVVKALNAPGTYRGEIVNRANIGLTDAQYKERWDAAHPEKPLVLKAS